MDARFKVISIGALAAHPLWGEREDVRPGHATTTLIEAGGSGGARILVDPSLPREPLAQRLKERANMAFDAITHVFLTSFQPLRRRALAAFERAEWLISERERETIGVSLVERLREAMEHEDDELIKLLEPEVAILQRCKAAPDSIVEGVDLFPLYGVTPGTCGLLLPTSKATILVCGDAVPTSEHLEQGKVLPNCADVEQAQESFREAIDIADLLVLGRDNMVLNPLRRPF
jgi:glyoxylase-like metal-dependent hydrolase (beta-lactamase superfamily II)